MVYKGPKGQDEKIIRCHFFYFLNRSWGLPRGVIKPIFSLFWHEWASDRRCETLDSSIMKIFSSSIDLDGSQDRLIGLKGGL